MNNAKVLWLAGIVAVISVFIFCLPIWITQVSWIQTDYIKTGPIGDTVGGFWGPGIAFIGAVLTFFAFYVQYQANQEQRNAIAMQAKNWAIERFESRFFEMIRLHKENVAEIKVDVEQGRKCFVGLFEELKFIHDLLKIRMESMETARGATFNGVRLFYLAAQYYQDHEANWKRFS